MLFPSLHFSCFQFVPPEELGGTSTTSHSSRRRRLSLSVANGPLESETSSTQPCHSGKFARLCVNLLVFGEGAERELQAAVLWPIIVPLQKFVRDPEGGAATWIRQRLTMAGWSHGSMASSLSFARYLELVVCLLPTPLVIACGRFL